MMLVGIACIAGCGEAKEKVDLPVASEDTASSKNADNESLSGYIFDYKGLQISIGAVSDDITGVLGNPEGYYEAPSCAFDGIEKIYTYANFEIVTYNKDGRDRVASVLLLNDLVETKEGIFLGNSSDDVVGAYGEPAKQTDTSLSYEKDNMKLVFILDNDVVVQIEYLTIEEQ